MSAGATLLLLLRGSVTTRRAKVNLGAGFVAKPVKINIAASWVEKPIKTYNGSVWQ